MEFKKKDIFITGVTAGKSKKTNESYVVVQFIDPDDNSTYKVIDKNLDILQKVHSMEKWKINCRFSSGNYGIKIEITDWLEKIGQI